MTANPKLIGTASKTLLNSRGGFLSSHKPSRLISNDPREILRCLVMTDGPVDEVGRICEKNPLTAEWLVRKIEDVDDLRVRDGKAPGRFDVYMAAARQAIARAECNALLDEIREGKWTKG